MKNILITGAGGGMGRATAELLVGEGFCVFALDKKPPQQKNGIIPVEVDVTSEKSVKQAMKTVLQHTKKLSAIIHFAGIYMLDSLAEIEVELFRKIFDINLYGAFLVNKTFLPMLEKGGKILITTSELAPLDPLPFTGIYAVSKSALDKYAYSLAMELQLLDISVSVLRAGAVDTDMIGVSTSALDRFCNNTKLYTCNADRFKNIVDRVEARRVPPERIAKKVLSVIGKRKPAFAYSINRNLFLMMLNALPKTMQMLIIKTILK